MLPHPLLRCALLLTILTPACGDTTGGGELDATGPDIHALPPGDTDEGPTDAVADTEDDALGPMPFAHIPNLVFSTTFPEGLSVSDDDICFGEITAPESEQAAWSALEGGDPFGDVRFYFEGGSTAQRSVTVVEDPDDPTNSVLYTRVDAPNVLSGQTCDDAPSASPCDAPGDHKARIQMVLRENPNLQRFDYQVRLRLGPGFTALRDAANDPEAPLTSHWMTIAEFWNNLANEAYPFRITLGVHPHAGAGLELALKADKRITNDDGSYTWKHLWPEEEAVADYEVPIEQWFTLHVSLTAGDEDTGRATVSLVQEDGSLATLIDVTGLTQHPDEPAEARDGFKDINPIKVYTSGAIVCGLAADGYPLDIWWDDFAIGGSAE